MRPTAVLPFCLLLLAGSCFLAVSAQTIAELLAQEPLFSQTNAVVANTSLETFLNAAFENGTIAFLAPVNQPSGLGNVTLSQLEYLTLNGTLGDLAQPYQYPNTTLLLDTIGGRAQRLIIITNNSETLVGPTQVSLNTTAMRASNGELFALADVVPLPGSINSVLSADPSLSTLVGALTAADISLDDSVTSVTVFAPSNAAFSKLAEQSSALFQYLNSASGLADLTQVLSYHAAQTVFYPDEVPEAGVYTYSTLVTGQSINITNSGSALTVGNNDVEASLSPLPIPASNGVVYVIDEVLLPLNFQFTMEKALLGSNLTTLLQLLKDLGLTEYLNYTSPITIFAPINAAFEGQNATADLLKYHIVTDPSALTQKLLSLPQNGILPSLLPLTASANGATQQLSFYPNENNVPTVNGVPLSSPLTGSVGDIYRISSILVPPSNNLIAAAGSADLQKFTYAVGLDFAEVQLEVANTTIFAPTDDAFDGPIGQYLLLNTNQSNADLLNVLKYHLVAGNNYYYVNSIPALPASVDTLDNEAISVTTTNGTVTLNGNAQITQPNILASDGVLHGINQVLIPTNFIITNDKIIQGWKATIFLNLVSETGLTELLDGQVSYTAFVFTDAAYDKAPEKYLENPSLWSTVVRTHIYNGTIDTLVGGQNYTMLSGAVVHIIDNTTLQVWGEEGSGKPQIKAGPIQTSNGVVYLINGILTVDTSSGDDGGLSDTTIGFIVIGAIVAVLLVIGAVGGGYWYYKRRAGYEKIGESTF